MGGGDGWCFGGCRGEREAGSASPGSTKFGCLVCVTSFFDGDGMARWHGPCVCVCVCLLLDGMDGLAQMDSGRERKRGRGPTISPCCSRHPPVEMI